MRTSRFQRWALAAAVVAAPACKKAAPEQGTPSATTGLPPAPAASIPAEVVPAAPPAADAHDPARYGWLGDQSLKAPEPAGTLSSRIPTPPGYERVAVEEGSFGAWLRELPLAAAGTAVKNHRGDVVHPADDDYLAAVVAIDIGSIDLQQSPDVVIRLHAEWLWAEGDRNMSYVGATGLDMPLARWTKGQRLLANGADVFWVQKAKPGEPDHAELRRYLDGVFTWANSTSLAQQAKQVEAADVRPGDFFLHTGSPGHALLILDIAQKGDRKLALFAQALNPAENIHVLRPGRATAWFTLVADRPVVTPFTEEFGWDGLRRLERPAPPQGDASD